MNRCPRCTTPLRANGDCGPCTFHWSPAATPARFGVAPQPGFTLAAAAQARIDARGREQVGAA